jgi:hypothetical protein
MDCKTARLLIDLCPAPSRELQGEEAAALSGHLVGCPDCGPVAAAELAFHEAVGQAMRRIAVPDGMHARILARLRSKRGDQHRRILARVTRAAAACAAVLLLALMAWHYWQPRKLAILPEPIAEHVALDRNAGPEEVEQYFASNHHRKIVAPTEFNYAFLAYFGMDDRAERSKPVPLLLFRRGDVEANVFVFSSRDFDLDSIKDNFRASTGPVTVEVWKPQGRPDLAYVIVYTGKSLLPLLNEGERPAA